MALDARLFYTIEGHDHIRVGATEYEMDEFSLIIINSGVPYHILTPESFVKYIQINFDFTQNALSVSKPVIPVLTERFQTEMLLDFHEFEDAPQLSRVLYISKIGALLERLSSIMREYMQKLLYYKQKAGYLLGDCICDCVRRAALGEMSEEKTKHTQILSYVQEHYAEKLTNESVGRLFGYHLNYVSCLIKQSTGLSLHAYIIKLRLENAMSLLVNSGSSVDEIATSCGFYDAACFCKLFKKHFNTTPAKYRNI